MKQFISVLCMGFSIVFFIVGFTLLPSDIPHYIPAFISAFWLLILSRDY